MDSLSLNGRVGLMGGSFDPVHIGHLIIARDALEQLNLSEVVFIPASIPPHKQHLRSEDISHRLEMLQLAVEEEPYFSVSDVEARRGGVSYSLDTIKEMSKRKPDAELILIVGSDTLVDLHNWYKINELLGLCKVASFLRPGECGIDQIREKVKLSDTHKDRLISNVFKTHLIDISSTEVRQRVKEERTIRHLVPQEVEQYIFEHSLYKG
jgi:nicotinate-nucleotide adenylyltransferase